MNPKFLIKCTSCSRKTNRAYARAHAGQCKQCAEPGSHSRNASGKPTRSERILEHGYQAYAREEGHYD